MSSDTTSSPGLPAMSGDGWVNCAQGHAHWGRYGGAGLLPIHRGPDGQSYVLLQHRAAGTDQGGTWSVLGGARNSDESAAQAALREAVEKSDIDVAAVHIHRIVHDDHGGWSFDTVLAATAGMTPVLPAQGESVGVAWVAVADVPQLPLHPGFAGSWERVRTTIDAVLDGEIAPDPAPATALPLPGHPLTDAPAIARQALPAGDDPRRRELITFADGASMVHEQFDRAADADRRLLDLTVGRAVGARLPRCYTVGAGQLYLDHLVAVAAAAPGTPAAVGAMDLAATRDGVFLGLHYALTAAHTTGHGRIRSGPQHSLLVDDPPAGHGTAPDAANPFVQTFYRQVEPRVFSWVDNPLSDSDITIIRRQLTTLQPLFAHLGRADLFDTVMERFGHVAQHARGTRPLLPLPPAAVIALPPADLAQHHLLPPPVDSPERLDQQRQCEQLLTSDGTIAHTGQAKTTAITALAERLDTPTPALVLASFGLVVGSDMAHRLGDGDYVLVPHNPQYPSMGADVLHRAELDEPGRQQDRTRALPMNDPAAETLVRQIAVSELMSSWSYGSNNNVRVLALQQAAQQEFGLTHLLDWHLDSATRNAVALELDYNGTTLRDFLRAQYALTQETLAARGITEVITYRALTWSDDTTQPQWTTLQVGDTFEARQRPLSSWAGDRQIVADWVIQRGGRAAILVDRKPARDILSIPTTGMGYFAQKELVALPGDSLVTLDGIFQHDAPPQGEPTAASAVRLGGPALQRDAAAGPPPAPTPSDRWRPLTITAQLDPADPVDRRILHILDGQEPAPSWWPHDDSGFTIGRRDLQQLGINPIQIKWLLTGEAPMGMTPPLYQQFCTEMLAALQQDGIAAPQLDIRLKGTAAEFFSGLHKAMPVETDLAADPQARRRWQDWLGAAETRPLRRPHDAMWHLGLESTPSDYDLDINSTAIVRGARDYWRTHHSERYQGDFMGGHGYLDKRALAGACPHLMAWAARWENALGRPVSLGVFEMSGPFNTAALGRPVSSHHRDTDWIIHRPDQPYAWRIPQSKIAQESPRTTGHVSATSPITAATAAFPQSTRSTLGKRSTTQTASQPVMPPAERPPTVEPRPDAGSR